MVDLAVLDFLVEFVVSCDYVFYRRAILGLLQSQGVNQNALIGDGGSHTLELSQVTTCQRQLSEYGRSIETAGIQGVKWS